MKVFALVAAVLAWARASAIVRSSVRSLGARRCGWQFLKSISYPRQTEVLNPDDGGIDGVPPYLQPIVGRFIAQQAQRRLFSPRPATDRRRKTSSAP